MDVVAIFVKIKNFAYVICQIWQICQTENIYANNLQ